MTTARRSETLSHDQARSLVDAWADGRSGAIGSLLGRVTAVDQVGVEERVDALRRRSIKKQSKLWALDLAIRMMDLTTLEGKDTPGKVRALCAKGMHPLPGDPTIPHVAAICVYPSMVADAKDALQGSGVKVASVATGFPSGQTFRDIQVKEAVGPAHLKVILETGELETYDNVRRASILAMTAGADFIKTSTGKVTPAATLPVTLVMLEAIRDFENATGRQVGMKPAGGIRTSKDAIAYLVVLYETLGPRWMSPDWFRFGASGLLNDVLMQIQKERTGRYQDPDRFSLD
jgi:deoxyribose-phosphate aldolase